MKNPLFLIVQKLLSKNAIIHDKKELAFQIQSHPSYPSLHAVTGVLDHFNIENIAAEVPTDSQTLQQLPDSFIAQVTTDKGEDLVTVSKLKDKLYSIFDSENKKETKLSEGEFLTRFTGIIVAVEKPEHQEIKRSNNSLAYGLLLALVVLIATSLIVRDTSIVDISYIILSVLGIVTSYSILKQELGESTIIGNAFCSGNDEKKDCDAVLNSKGAEIIKGHKLSDLSIIYFSGLLLASLLSNDISLLKAISITSLPITIYSIYYQYKVVKSWCLLCLSIVGILWVQASTAFIDQTIVEIFSSLTLESIMITSISFLTIYLAWYYIKPLVSEKNKLQGEKIEFVKFKRNFNLFNSLLQKSPTLDTNIVNANEMILGNPSSPLAITIITNPFCGHCKEVHEVVNETLKKYDNAVKIIVRFNIPTDNLDNPAVTVTNTLLELYHSNKKEEAKNAMDDIYDGLAFEKWSSKWAINNGENKYIDTLKKGKEWCVSNAINFTPEILVNGKSFPKEYKRSDLVFFIEDLEEHYNLTSPQAQEI